jgi:zinc transporter ZupT
MRVLGDIVGILIVVVGVLSVLAGLALSSRFYFLLAVALFVVAGLILRAASHKSCPQCAESVKHEALKCKHCGHQFATAPKSSVSEPFYK